MKRKLRGEETKQEDMGGSAWATQTRPESVAAAVAADSLKEPRIVSHVPPSARSSRASFSSTTSSISSAQCHPVRSFSRKEGDETHRGEPPQLKPKVSARVDELEGSETSSVSSRVILKPSPNATVHASPQLSGFKRTISFVSGDISDSASQKAKRACVSKPVGTAAVKPPEVGRLLLLATDKDRTFLSPLHIFVRQQIEVFEASEEDLKQPAPGRRIPIQLKQVGLRCIHCKHQKARERKKRAVCYPSSVGRVYHSVSDMKFAHFPCSQMPEELLRRLSELKDQAQLQGKLDKGSSSKRTGSSNACTAQYYHDSARELGMGDGKGGIYAQPCLSQLGISALAIQNGKPLLQALCPQPDHSLTIAAISQLNTLQGVLFGSFMPAFAYVNGAVAEESALATAAMITQNASAPATSAAAAAVNASTFSTNSTISLAVVPVPLETNKSQPVPPHQAGSALLASEMDKHYLAPIHCFVRRHVEVFAATQQDIAAPAPGRKKPIALGQVGLRCVHCAKLPVKERVKRAICYPPSVSGVYHAVSNMKFDHFKLCRGMPKEARDEFQGLASSPQSGTGGVKRSSNDESTPRPRVSNSTAQYYHDSALGMGLRDTPEGIRMHQPLPPMVVNNIPGNAAAAKDAAGMEALIIAATDPKVRAAHEQRQSLLGGAAA
jgi:hypothetical protein